MSEIGVWINCGECGEERAYFNPANQTLDVVSCRSCGAGIDRWHAFGHAPWCVGCGEDLSECVCPQVSDALISLERIVAGLSAPVREGSAEDVDPDAFRGILAEAIAEAHAGLSGRFGGAVAPVEGAALAPLVRGGEPTVNCGQLIAFLSQFPADMPVTVEAGALGVSWLNVQGASNPFEYGEPSVIIYTADDFDTRQW